MIGVFDSGVGGLSVLKEVIKNNLDENYIYYGDTKNLPYGVKTKEEIINYTRNIVKFLILKGAKAAIIACNTTSALAYEALQNEFQNEIKIYPLIQTVAPYIAKSANKIGIMATEGTAKSFTYTKEILKTNPNAEVYEKGCSGLVEIVENRLYEKKESVELVYEKLKPLLEAGCEKIVLGCTHYPYLLPILEKFAPADIFINPSYSLVDAIKGEFKISTDKYNVDFYVSFDPVSFVKNAQAFYEIKNNAILADNLDNCCI